MTVKKGPVRVTVERDGARWQIRDGRGRLTLGEHADGGLRYERDGIVHGLVAVERVLVGSLFL